MAVSLSTFGQTTQHIETKQAEAATLAAVAASSQSTNENNGAASNNDANNVANNAAAPAVENGQANAAAPASNGQVQAPTDEIKDTLDFEIGIEENQQQGLAATQNEAQAASQSQAQAPQSNWKEEIKKVDRAELYKEIGLSDFAIELNEHMARGGAAADYLNAKAIDWNNVSDEDIIKSKLRQQYTGWSKDDINRMYDRKYASGLTDDEKSDDELQLKADAFTERQAKIAEQAKYKLPEPKSVEGSEKLAQFEQSMAERQKKIDKVTNYYNNHAATKTLLESKRVTIGFGEGIKPLNLNINKPELILRALTDDGTIMQQLTTTKTGEPDVEKEQLMTAFAFNPQGFIQRIFNYGMEQGVRKKLVEEGQNAVKPGAVVSMSGNDQKPTYSTGRFNDKSRN
jgi:hypothetical protein